MVQKLSLLLFISVVVCSSTADSPLSVPLIRMKSGLETIGSLNLHPSKLHRLMEKTDNATVPLRKFLDLEYYGQVQLGFPRQTFNVIFDTAWANSWVPSVKCNKSQVACQIHNKFECRPPSCKQSSVKFVVNMGARNLSGNFVTDSVHIGAVNITNQTFAEVTEIPWTFVFNKADGIFGMAFDTYAIENVTPFFYNMLKQGTVKKGVFSFYMNRDRSSTRAGTLFLGGVEKRHYKGNFTFTPVVKLGYWQFHMDSVTVKGSRQTFCEGGCDAIADTSSNAIEGPEQEILYINQLIKARPFFFGRFVIDCKAVYHLPSVTFVISGKKFELTTASYVQYVEWGGFRFCMSAFKVAELPRELGKMWILGGAFLSKYYVQFDLDKHRIGFADVK